MRKLIVASTYTEISPFYNFLQKSYHSKNQFSFVSEQHDIDILIHGVSSMLTAYHLGAHLATNHYDQIIQAGIAGSFDYNLKPGQVVEVTTDQFGDIGAQNKEGTFLDAFELGLLADEFPFNNKKLTNPSPLLWEAWPAVNAVTVNTVTGTQSSIDSIKEKYDPQIETMEGAAFFYCCLDCKMPFVALRSISNYVEPRNKANWKLELAVEELNIALRNLVA